jgi:alpha-glucosidase (family GH31 glycosyl hydrolase)/AraC-like DNA-binding protein
LSILHDDVQFRTLNGNWVRIQVWSACTFRIRFSAFGEFPEPPLNRYGILHPPNHPATYTVTDDHPLFTVQTDQAALQIDKRNGAIAWMHADGRMLLEQDGPPQFDSGKGYGLQFRLNDHEKLYGLGDETRSRLQKRGHLADIHVEAQRAYLPIPFLMSSMGWGMLVNTTWRHTADIGHSVRDRLQIRCDGGEPDVYMMAGDSYPQLLNLFTDITGKPALLPLWAYGLTFSCNVQANARDVVEDALNFRREDIPCDMLGLEPGWMETYYDHTTEKKWHPERFSIPLWDSKGPRTFMGALDRLGFKLSLWLCCNYDLTRHEERQLAGEADEEHGPEEDWYTHLSKFVDQGVSAFKLDGGHKPMAEPERIWANGMSPAEIHNLYPLLLAKQMHNGYTLQTGRRAMIYAMTGYTGIQQYAATWAGTSGGSAESLVSLLNHSMSGHIHTTCDMDIHSPAGIHFGFLQPWSHLNNFAYWQHPCLLTPELLHLFRRYAKLRYSLIPYLYSAAHSAVRTGMPILRAMPLCYPDDARSDDLFHQYMLGDYLLVAVQADRVYLPEGTWIDYWTEETYTGPREFQYSIPEGAGGALFVKAGAIIPVWPKVDCIGTRLPERIGVHLYPGSSEATTLYEDDGTTYRYQEGQISETKISVQAGAGNVIVQIDPRSGHFEGMPRERSYDMYIHLDTKPYKLSVNGAPLKEWNLKPDGPLPRGGWYYDPALRQTHLFVEEDQTLSSSLQVHVRFDETERRKAAADTAAALQGPDRHDNKPELAYDNPASKPDSGPKPVWSFWQHDVEISLMSGNLAPLYDSLDIISEEHRSFAWSADEIREFLLYLSGTFIRIAERQGWKLKDIAGDDYNEVIQLSSLPLSEGTRCLLRRVMQRFADQFRFVPAPSMSPLIKQVIALLEQSADQELSLQNIAEQLHVNSSHLSRAFRKELGKPFSTYVLEKKMQRAKQLLLEGVRIIEVSMTLGYRDPSHFNRVFRTYWGMTPGELVHPPKKNKTPKTKTIQ